jgi:hypothetical protein
MAEFVRAQIFGTTFEITSRYEYKYWETAGFPQLTVDQIHRSATRGHGSIWPRLVFARRLHHFEEDTDRVIQFGQGPAYPTTGRCEEDHETFLHPSAIEADLSRVETSQTSST